MSEIASADVEWRKTLLGIVLKLLSVAMSEANSISGLQGFFKLLAINIENSIKVISKHHMCEVSISIFNPSVKE